LISLSGGDSKDLKQNSFISVDLSAEPVAEESEQDSEPDSQSEYAAIKVQIDEKQTSCHQKSYSVSGKSQKLRKFLGQHIKSKSQTDLNLKMASCFDSS